jgi:3-oxoacyl-(acyl-carrier-protein) synthase
MTAPVPEVAPEPPASQSIAIVGLACRFPDADDPAALLDAVLTGRRAFRRIPPARLDLAEYYNPDPRARDATYSTRAALLEGWRFDLGAFGISGSDFASTEPEQWLALETAGRALAAAGFPAGAGLPAGQTGVFIGHTPAKDGAPAAALRLRWPYTRRVLADALAAAGIPPRAGHEVIAAAAARYLAPFPPITERSLTGGSAASIATTITGRFGLGGGGFLADAGGASSLAAISSACLALAAGQVDAAVAGGIDLGIDPYDLVTLAIAGRLARAEMRVYDAHPTGFLPGEGCGAVLLMRASDARAKGLPVYAEIVGWGSASQRGTSGDEDGDPAALGEETRARLLAMRRAHEMAGIEPAEVQLVEGTGAGIGADDDAELAALAELRAGSRHVAALGAVSANIGNAGAAAGAAALIKTVLAIANGVLPPSTGVRTPHPMLRDGRAALRLPVTPEPWPAGIRHAGVAAAGAGGLAFHLILRGEPGEHIAGTKAPQLRPRALPRAVQTRPPSGGRSLRQARLRARSQPQPQNLTEPALRLAATRVTGSYASGPGHTFAYLLRTPDRAAMIKLLSRIALIAPWLTDAQMQDLAVHLARSAAGQGETAGHEIRLALTAASQEQLAALAREARALVPAQQSVALSIRPGIYIAAGPTAKAAPAASGRTVGTTGTSGTRHAAAADTAAVPGDASCLAGTEAATDTARANDVAEVTEAEVTQSGAAQPGATRPGVAQAEAAQPEAIQPGATQPEVSQAEVTQAKADQPDATQSEATLPEATLPEATQPKVTRAAEAALAPGQDEATNAVAAVTDQGEPGQPGAKIALVIAAQPDELTDLPQRQLSRLLAILRLLDDLGVEVSAAVGHGIGEVAGLVWAGCTTPSDARTLIALRSAALAASADAAPGELGTTIGKFGTFGFRAARRRLISGCTGSEISEPNAIAEMLCAELFEARLAAAGRQRPGGSVSRADAAPEATADADETALPAEAAAAQGPTAGARAHAQGAARAAVRGGEEGASAARLGDAMLAMTGSAVDMTLGPAIAAAVEGAGLLVQTGQDRMLARAVAELGLAPVTDGGPGSPLPAISIDGDPSNDASIARTAAALFAAGAMTRPDGLYARRPSRPIDIWHDPVFITHPCQRPVRMPQIRRAEPAVKPAATAPARPAATAPGAQPIRVQAAPGPHELKHPRQEQGAAVQQAVQPATAAARPATRSPAAEPGTPAASPASTAGDPAAIHTKTGAKPWFRCYAERTQPPSLPWPAGDDQPWRIYTGGCGPLDRKAGEIFRHDPSATRTLVVLGPLEDQATSEAAVQAARDAIGTGQLVAISAGQGPAGLWASLHAEQPAVGVTAIRAPLTADGMAAARRVAAAVPGEFRELVVGEDGTVTEPVMQPVAALGGSEFPLGPDDVVLISRGSGAAGLTLAQVLALSGAAIAIVGRFHPAGDEQVVAGIDQLRAAGARIGYELVDLADHAALVAAVRRIEARLGCVTAIGHATGSLPRVAVRNLTPQAMHGQVRAHTAPLDQLAAAVRTIARSGSSARRGRLRLIVTSGSVTGRYGLAAEGIGAFVAGALASCGERTAAASPGCQTTHIDWPAWSGEALGERPALAEAMARAGYAALPVGEASRLLLKALATDGLPRRLAIHGRVGVPAPRAIAAASTLGSAATSQRFIERVLVHYPGVELITEARLSLLADPYLLDYRADGVPVLPPTMALEAMAQVASALAGAPVRHASKVAMRAPIVLASGMPEAQTVIRIYALRDAGTITIRVRCDNSGFAVDHCRATFLLAPGGPDIQEPSPRGQGSAAPAGELPAAALYGSVLFQAGRFRQLRGLRLTGPRSAMAEAGHVGAASQLPWFGAVPPARAGTTGQDLVLGDAALSDAGLQVVQACLQDRRMLFAGCDTVWFSDQFGAGKVASGPVTIEVSQEPAGEAGDAGDASDASDRENTRVSGGDVPRPRAGSAGPADAQDGPRWRVRMTDAGGAALLGWDGLRMRDVGPLQQPSRQEVSRLASSD